MPVTVTTVLAVALGVSLWLSYGSTPPATTTTTVAPHDFTPNAVWPLASSSTRYASAAAAVRGFAAQLLSSSTPVLGTPNHASTSRVVVPVQTNAGGPVTLVDVRQLSVDRTWWVMMASTSDITVSSPSSLSVVTSPIRLSGSGVAFEGVINVSLRGDLSSTPLMSLTVRGGGTQSAPFHTSIVFSPGQSRAGDLILYERSAKDGSVTCATVERVRF